ncbi:dimethyl sulfoxide reductase anchor subunit family protein [Chloroflexota bacterium]
MKRWSLILFTVITQISVGSFWTAQFFLPFEDYLLFNRSLYASFVLMLIGLSFSLSHLNSPIRAYFAVSNLRNSWLSREIIFALLYTTFLGITILNLWLNFIPRKIIFVLIWTCSLLGFLLLYSMIRVYMQRTINTWNTFYTPISFFSAALILGALLFNLIVQGAALPGWLIIILLILIILRSSLLPRSLAILAQSIPLKDILIHLQPQFILNLILSAISLVLVGFLALNPYPATIFRAIALCLLSLDAFVDRYMFYNLQKISQPYLV